VLQEVYLAPKLLYLEPQQLRYECVEGIACETSPGWAPSAWFDSKQIFSPKHSGKSVLTTCRRRTRSRCIKAATSPSIAIR